MALLTFGLTTWSAPARYIFPGREADEQVIGVGAEAGHQPHGALDPRLLQALVHGRVSLDDPGVGVELEETFDAIAIAFDPDVRLAHRGELLGHLPARTPKPADDHVVVHLLDRAHDTSPAEDVLEVELDDEGGEDGEPETHPGEAAEEEEHGEGPPRLRQGDDLRVAHRRERDGGHVDGVRDVRVLDDDVAPPCRWPSAPGGRRAPTADVFRTLSSSDEATPSKTSDP